MEIQFKNTPCGCLDTVLREVQNSEGTLEIRVPDGMPDIGRILASWGQTILRGKEWRSEEILFSGGMMVWVLYAPEDGTGPRCMEGWIPFQMRWDLPGSTRDGQIRIDLKSRFVDARSVSARKIMVRAGLAAMAEALVPGETQLFEPEQPSEEVELKRERFPLRLMKEAGEKTFLLAEELSMPASAPQPEKILYCSLNPEITDQKVLANKVVFRGNGNLHMLYAAEDGKLYSWDFPLAFSQLAELEGSCSGDARVHVILCATTLEPEIDDEGALKLKCALVGQYLVDDLQMVEVVTDAYSPGRGLEVTTQELRLPVILDTGRESVFTEQSISAAAGSVVDVSALADYPRVRNDEDAVQIESPGAMQVLYLDAEGALQSVSGRVEGMCSLRADGNSQVFARPLAVAQPQLLLGGERMDARWELPVETVTTQYTHIPMISALELGEEKNKDSGRPSLILKRVGTDGLWEIAKRTGSTVDAIRKANNLDTEPEPGRMLLIPVR